MIDTNYYPQIVQMIIYEKSLIDWHTVLLRKHLVCLIQLIGRIHQISKTKMRKT